MSEFDVHDLQKAQRRRKKKASFQNLIKGNPRRVPPPMIKREKFDKEKHQADSEA